MSITHIYIITPQWVSTVVHVLYKSKMQNCVENGCFHFGLRYHLFSKWDSEIAITHNCKYRKYRKCTDMFYACLMVLLISMQIYIAAVSKMSSVLIHGFRGAMSKLVPSTASVRATSATTVTLLIANGLILTSWHQGIFSLGRHRLSVIGVPIINMRRSSDCLRFIVGIDISVKWYLKTWCPLLLLWFDLQLSKYSSAFKCHNKRYEYCISVCVSNNIQEITRNGQILVKIWWKCC